MVKILIQEDKKLYQCEACGFHYESKEQAEKCEAWCKEHNSCNLEITAEAEENKNTNVYMNYPIIQIKTPDDIWLYGLYLRPENSDTVFINILGTASNFYE